MKAADLFAGAGGFSIGARLAGVPVVWAANHWPAAVHVHERNHPDTAHACQDLQQADWATVPAHDLRRAMAKFPTWPTDPLHAIAVVNEEVGELNKELLQLTYEPHKVKPEGVHTEAVQSAAMALRFLASLARYEFRECVQHSQAVAMGGGL